MRQNRLIYRIIIAIVVLCQSLASTAQIDTTIVSCRSLKLKGNVKILHQSAYKAEDVLGELRKGAPSEDSFAYDSYGDKYTLGIGQITLTFNKQGHETFVTFKSFGEQYFTITELNNGRIISSKDYEGEVLMSKSIYNYDSNWRPVSLLRYDSNGDLIHKEKCTYNAHGDLLTWYSFDKSGKVEDYNVNTYKYNQSGYISYETNKNYRDGTSSSQYFYNAKGLEVKDIQHNSDGSVSTITTQYNNVDLPSKITVNCTIKKYSNVRFITYDSIGRKLSETVKTLHTERLCWQEKYDYDNNTYVEDYYSIGRWGKTYKDGRIVRYTKEQDEYTYEYKNFDDNGNWTTAIEFKNTIPTLYIERSFEYY